LFILYFQDVCLLFIGCDDIEVNPSVNSDELSGNGSFNYTYSQLDMDVNLNAFYYMPYENHNKVNALYRY
jgi:hypothetical protein